jgi:hypothetical protein
MRTNEKRKNKSKWKGHEGHSARAKEKKKKNVRDGAIRATEERPKAKATP